MARSLPLLDRDFPFGEPSAESTGELLRHVRGGNEDARERLFARCLPILQRWAHRRLPFEYRDIADTDDLVQLTLLRAFRHLDSFEWRGEGAFLAYLRAILLNAVRDEVRRTGFRLGAGQVRSDAPAEEREAAKSVPSELERFVRRDQLDRYERALEALPERERVAIILRLEFELDYRALAEAIEAPGANAARMTVSRARARLSQLLGEDSPTA